MTSKIKGMESFMVAKDVKQSTEDSMASMTRDAGPGLRKQSKKGPREV